MVRDWIRSAFDQLCVLINRRARRVTANQPTLRELYERAVDIAEAEAAAEWRRCFDTTAEMRRRCVALGTNSQSLMAESLQLIEPSSEVHGRESHDWSAPVVREIPTAKRNSIPAGGLEGFTQISLA